MRGKLAVLLVAHLLARGDVDANLVAIGESAWSHARSFTHFRVDEREVRQVDGLLDVDDAGLASAAAGLEMQLADVQVLDQRRAVLGPDFADHAAFSPLAAGQDYDVVALLDSGEGHGRFAPRSGG